MGTGYYFYSQFLSLDRDPAIKVAAPTLSPLTLSGNADGYDDDPVNHVSPRDPGLTAADINQLLAHAERHLVATPPRLTRPQGENAFEAYTLVLQLDPENARAKTGLATIAQFYKRLAQEAEKRGQLRRSLALVEKGLDVLPGYEGLVNLKKEIDRQVCAN